MAWLFNLVKEFCATHGFEKNYWVAYSGGLDSHVLLHLLATLRSHYPLQLQAIYVNHGLSPHASSWAEHCAKVCDDLQIPFHSKTVALASHDENIEETARNARYAIFAKHLSAGEMLLTAHHQNDQAETVLLQLLRGAGPKGLAAMPRIKSFAEGTQGRPFLNVSREELTHYAEQHQLKWIDDESNANIHFPRNFLRHEILPLLKKRWPSVMTTLARSAEHCSQLQELVENLSADDLVNIAGTFPQTISIQKLLTFNAVRQRQLLRLWLSQLKFPLPSTIKLRQIQQDMLHAREDRFPYFSWKEVELRRYRDNLYAMKKLPLHDPSQIIPWDMSKDLELPGIGILSAKNSLSDVTIRFRQGGEKYQHRDLKKLFQEWGIPPWERNRVPLLYVGETLKEIVGFSPTRIARLSPGESFL